VGDRGRPRQLPVVACPNPLHRGSRVKGDGTRFTQSGRRRDYRCRPSGYPVHKFAVVISAADEPVVARTPAPACPVHGSAAKIGRWGSYAVRPKEVRRQRYRCVPTEPGERGKLRKHCHYFTPTMAREHVDFGQLHCGECGETRGVHHGEPVVARAQSWPLRVAAEGLSRIAAGESYSAVGRWAWEVTGRTRTRPAKLSAAERSRRQAVADWHRSLPRRRKSDPEPAPPAGLSLEPLPSDENYRRRRRIDTAGNVLPPRRTPSPSAARARARWHVAADWTEMYAAAIWQPMHERLLADERAEHDRRQALTPEQRAADGRPQVLLLDDLPVMTRAAGGNRSRRSYFVLAAGTVSWSDPRPAGTRGRDGRDRPEPTTKLRLLRGFATNEAESWLLLFQELGYVPGVYEPEVILADAGTGLQKAVRKFFRTAVLVPSLWHVKSAVTQALMKKSGPGAVRFTDLGLALHPRLGNLLDDLSAERLRARGVAGWKAWWDDLHTAMTELDLSTTAVRERRASYEPVVTRALPTLAANPAVPVSTGGFEMVLRARASALIAGRSHALANLERCASLFDLCVCRDQGEFHSLPAVIKALTIDNDTRGGWAAAPRLMADPQPPVPAGYSSLRDRRLPVALASVRGLR
jgi:hypothetical protein